MSKNINAPKEESGDVLDAFEEAELVYYHQESRIAVRSLLKLVEHPGYDELNHQTKYMAESWLADALLGAATDSILEGKWQIARERIENAIKILSLLLRQSELLRSDDLVVKMQHIVNRMIKVEAQLDQILLQVLGTGKMAQVYHENIVNNMYSVPMEAFIGMGKEELDRGYEAAKDEKLVQIMQEWESAIKALEEAGFDGEYLDEIADIRERAEYKSMELSELITMIASARSTMIKIIPGYYPRGEIN